LTDLDERLTLAFADLFAENRSRFLDGEVAGGPGYYGVQVAAVTADASEVELVLTFRAGVRYCCFESGCHFAYYDERGWRRLRECLDRHGLGHLPLPVVRTFRGVIEPGAVAQPGMVGTVVGVVPQVGLDDQVHGVASLGCGHHGGPGGSSPSVSCRRGPRPRRMSIATERR
jgi:hypothetical protein